MCPQVAGMAVPGWPSRQVSSLRRGANHGQDGAAAKSLESNTWPRFPEQTAALARMKYGHSSRPPVQQRQAGSRLTVCFQPFCQFPRAAEGRTVATVDLVRGDSQALANDSATPVGREHPVFTAQQVSRRHIWPGVGGAMAPSPVCRTGAALSTSLGGQVFRNVTREDGSIAAVLLIVLLVTRIGEHLFGRFARQRNHSRHQHEEIRWRPGANERRGIAPERLRNYHDSVRSPIALTTVSVYSASPAESASHGKATATTS